MTRVGVTGTTARRIATSALIGLRTGRMRMAEFIDRQAALEAAKKSHLYFDIKPIINSIPAADVRPVVKSKWVKMKFFPDWECEKCGSVISGNTPDPWNHYHYCPNCGADMRPEPPKEE